VLAVPSPSGSPAHAVNVSCGDTITTDTTLHKNLVDCPNNGILIGADNVTLDLNGHLVDGDGTEFAGCDPNAEICDSGIVDDGHNGVTVKHGRVREFGIGVLVGTSSAGRVRHNHLLDISSSRNLFFGFVVASSARSLVRNSSGSGNLPPDGDGMGLFGSHHVRILHNSFRHNPPFSPGLHVAFDSNHNLIKGNLFSRNPDVGIALEDADRNRVRRNRFVRDGTGIDVRDGNRNVIARNRVFRAGRQGHGTGIGIAKGRGNLIARNVIVRRAPDDGVHVFGQAKHTLLRGNRARHTKDDGIDVDSRTTKLTANRAVRNQDLGIEAVRGVIDGGGNIARHNGDPRQCTHIPCK
jgi:parallel beta-helix repeat protein